MSELIWFLIGLMVGGVAGMITLALAMVAAASDRRMHELDPENQS